MEKKVKLKVYCEKIVQVKTQYGYTKVFIFVDPASHEIFTWRTTSYPYIESSKYYLIECNKYDYNNLERVSPLHTFNTAEELAGTVVHSASRAGKSKKKKSVDALDILLGLTTDEN